MPGLALYVFVLISIPFYDGIGQALLHADWDPLHDESFQVSLLLWTLSLFAMHPHWWTLLSFWVSVYVWVHNPYLHPGWVVS